MVELRTPTWLPGPPPGLHPLALTVDLAAYRPMVCPGCGSRWMAAKPQHTADGHYRLLLTCVKCRRVEVV